MISEKTLPIDVESSERRRARYTIATLNAITLIGTLLLIVWILGKIIGALHALVFSLALAETPNQFPKDFPILDDAMTNIEVRSLIQNAELPTENTYSYPIEGSVEHLPGINSWWSLRTP